MSSTANNRQLVAILMADISGFSRLTRENEDQTFKRVRTALSTFSDIIKQHDGKLIGYQGDSVFAIFNSARNALLCAYQAQTFFLEESLSQPESEKILFRTGLNLGDVIQDDSGVFGDDVNITSRIESLAPVGGISVSGAFYDAVASKADLQFQYRGEQSVKNIDTPVRIYDVIDKDLPGITDPGHKRLEQPRRIFAVLLLVIAILIAGFYITTQTNIPGTVDSVESIVDNPIPKIIVLPFKNLNSNKDDYLIDGITEDIITDLSRLASVKVLSGSSSFQYKGKPVNYADMAKQLEVTHIVEGSVRRAGTNLRITARLINANNAQTLWAERYDKSGNELFSLQDRMIRDIVNSMSLKITNREMKSLEHPTTSNFKAYDLYLKGRQLTTQRTANANQQAQAFYQLAINEDASFARAHGALAVAKIMAANNYWGENPEKEKQQALELAIKATELTQDSQHVYWALGFTYLYLKEHEKARSAVEKSLKIAPNYADAYALLALIKNNMGLPEASISLIQKAMFLNPLYSWDYLFNLGWAYYTLGDYEKSEALLQKALERNPNSRLTRLILIANYMANQMVDEAEWQVEELLLQYPALNMRSIQDNMPLIANQKSVRFLANLKKAGIPD